MQIRLAHGELKKSAGPVRRAFDYAFYDWTREMPKSKRVLTWAGILIQGYAVYAGITRSLIWPLMWPKGIAIYPTVSLLYLLGNCLMNGMLTSEFVRKTQLESDQVAARQIQQTLIPQELADLPGYDVETFYKPYREVGGDYFDVIQLPNNETLFAVADVSGKGMAAALLAATIQALVRSIANVEANPVVFAGQINQYLTRYTPADRFATAVFIVLNNNSGELTSVNAGHNPPMIRSQGATESLGPTGMPLGFFSDGKYEANKATLPIGASLLIFTDGLTDSIPDETPEKHLADALAENPKTSMANLQALVDPKHNEDDVTIILVKRNESTPTDRMV